MTLIKPRLGGRLAMALVAVLAVGCGPARQPPSGDLVGIGPRVYKAPIYAAVHVHNSRAAEKLISFKVLRPGGLGPPRAVLTTDPKRVPRSSRAIAFLFDAARYGRVDVVEEPMEVSRGEYDRENRHLVTLNDSPQTHGRAAIATVRGGKQALLTIAEDGTTADIFWMERPGMEVSIIGPSSTLETV